MIQVTDFERLPRFEKQYNRLPPEVAKAVNEALKLLLENPAASSLRLHALKGFRPTIYKIDVFPNKSWQVSFELLGTTARLRRVAEHGTLDRAP